MFKFDSTRSPACWEGWGKVAVQVQQAHKASLARNPGTLEGISGRSWRSWGHWQQTRLQLELCGVILWRGFNETNMSDTNILEWVIGCVVAFVLTLAQLKLFTIDRTLKAILAELRGEKPARPQPRPEVIERLRQKGMLPKE